MTGLGEAFVIASMCAAAFMDEESTKDSKATRSSKTKPAPVAETATTEVKKTDIKGDNAKEAKPAHIIEAEEAEEEERQRMIDNGDIDPYWLKDDIAPEAVRNSPSAISTLFSSIKDAFELMASKKPKNIEPDSYEMVEPMRARADLPSLIARPEDLARPETLTAPDPEGSYAPKMIILTDDQTEPSVAYNDNLGEFEHSSTPANAKQTPLMNAYSLAI